MKFGLKLSWILTILGLTLGAITVIFGVNEATYDVLDTIGSNYWLACSAIISGFSIMVITMVLMNRKIKQKHLA